MLCAPAAAWLARSVQLGFICGADRLARKCFCVRNRMAEYDHPPEVTHIGVRYWGVAEQLGYSCFGSS